MIQDSKRPFVYGGDPYVEVQYNDSGDIQNQQEIYASIPSKFWHVLDLLKIVRTYP